MEDRISSIEGSGTFLLSLIGFPLGHGWGQPVTLRAAGPRNLEVAPRRRS
jgi:hypothetical protein